MASLAAFSFSFIALCLARAVSLESSEPGEATAGGSGPASTVGGAVSVGSGLASAGFASVSSKSVEERFACSIRELMSYLPLELCSL